MFLTQHLLKAFLHKPLCGFRPAFLNRLEWMENEPFAQTEKRTNQSIYLNHKKTFSTNSTKYSIKHKLGKYYVFRDEMRLKTKDFLQRFSGEAFVKSAPQTLVPYLKVTRVDKPIGTWLLFLPCSFGICLATPLGSLPDMYYLALFGIGSFLMRGAGCIINDFWDRDLDKKVERTKERPLASGKISTTQAIALLAGQLSLSLCILLSLNTTCILIGIASMIPVILYPLAKRVTDYPQAVLGLTFNIGAIMGYVAVTGSFYWQTILPLYAGCFLWTMYYDTVYALQDIKDDAEIGIKSTALLLVNKYKGEKDFMELSSVERINEIVRYESKIKTALSRVQLSSYVLWLVAAVSQNASFPTIIVIALISLKVYDPDFRPSDVKMCHQKFLENKHIGLFFLIGIILGIYVNHPQYDVKKGKNKS